ncbi:MAG: hypothetical protein ACOYXW_03745 [Actinomycetota bacterium]
MLDPFSGKGDRYRRAVHEVVADGIFRNRRYVGGQRLYRERCRPEARASVVVDNNDLAAPWIVTSAEAG